MRTLLVIVALLGVTGERSLHAQRVDTLLGVQGTAAYNALWTSAGRPDFGRALAGLRFSGRVAVRVSQRGYLGVSVGSWEYASELAIDGVRRDGALTGLGTAVVCGVYGQAYVAGSNTLFVRGGTGWAWTKTYFPTETDGIETLALATATRLAPSVGLGLDFPMGKHLSMTAAADYAQLLGVPETREIKSTLATSIGLTLR